MKLGNKQSARATATAYQRDLIKSYRAENHERVVRAINDTDRNNFYTLEGWVWVTWLLSFVSIILLFALDFMPLSGGQHELVWAPEWLKLAIIPPLMLINRLHPALQKRGRQIYILNLFTPIIIPAYALWWKSEYETLMAKALDNNKETKALLSITLQRDNEGEALLTLRRMYAERKYQNLENEITARISKTREVIDTLLDPKSPFRKSEFVQNMLETLQAQNERLVKHLVEVCEKKKAISVELNKYREELQVLEQFRSVVEGAELVKDNEMFLKEYRFKVQEIETNAERLMLSTNRDVLDTQTLMKSLPEVQSLYAGS